MDSIDNVLGGGGDAGDDRTRTRPRVLVVGEDPDLGVSRDTLERVVLLRDPTESEVASSEEAPKVVMLYTGNFRSHGKSWIQQMFLESNRVALVRSDDGALDVHTAIKQFEEMRIRAPELVLEERRDFIPLYTKTRLGKGQRKKNKGSRWR